MQYVPPLAPSDAGTEMNPAANASEEGRPPKAAMRKPAAPARKFQFISADDPMSDRKVRSHVMKEYMQEKREKRIQGRAPLGGTSLTGQPAPRSLHAPVSRMGKGNVSIAAPSTVLPVRSVSSSTRTASNRPSLDGSQSTVESDSEGIVDLGYESLTHLWTPAESRLRDLRPMAPQTVLDSHRSDPFSSLPSDMDRESLILVNHYVHTLPSLMYGMPSLIKFAPMPDVFQLASQDKASLHSILTYSAAHMATLRGQRESMPLIRHKVATIRTVNERLRSATAEHSDGTVMAVQQLAAIEDRWGDKTVAKAHWSGLRSLVKGRGGLRAIRADCSLKAIQLNILLCWTDMTSDVSLVAAGEVPKIGKGQRHYNSPSASGGDTDLFEIADLPKHCEHFISFLNRIEELWGSYMMFARTGQTHALNSVRRQTFFQQGSILHLLLSSPQGIRQGVSSNVQECSRLACLLYLHATFLEYSHNGDMLDYFLGTLSINVLDYGINITKSVESLLIIFLRGEPHNVLDQPDRAWFVGRLMGVGRQLDEETWRALHGSLLRLLSLTDAEASEQNIQDLVSWDTAGIRSAIQAKAQAET